MKQKVERSRIKISSHSHALDTHSVSSAERANSFEAYASSRLRTSLARDLVRAVDEHDYLRNTVTLMESRNNNVAKSKNPRSARNYWKSRIFVLEQGTLGKYDRVSKFLGTYGLCIYVCSHVKRSFSQFRRLSSHEDRKG